MEPLSPEALARACQRSLPEDPRPFELLVKQYKELVFRTTYRLMGNQQDAEDQAQEVFVKIYRGVRDLEDPATLTSWIYRVTTNTCLDALRNRRRRPLGQGPVDAETEEEADYPDARTPTPEEAALRAELRRCLEETLRQMDPSSRLVLVLRDVEDRPYDEIAAILGIGLSAVKMRIHRIRLAFRQLLDRVCPDSWRKGPLRPRAGEPSAVAR